MAHPRTADDVVDGGDLVRPRARPPGAPNNPQRSAPDNFQRNTPCPHGPLAFMPNKGHYSALRTSGQGVTCVKLSALWHGFLAAIWHPAGVSTVRRDG